MTPSVLAVLLAGNPLQATAWNADYTPAAEQTEAAAAAAPEAPPLEDPILDDGAAVPPEEAEESAAGQSGAVDDPRITVTANSGASDPVEEVNLKSFEAVQAVDEAVIGPVAQAYEDVVPDPARAGLRNVLRNLEEPSIFVNNVLQLRFGRALKSAGRFALNSTIGVAGLFDVAKREPFGLPYKPNGFANTFACYGIGPGPYLYLPLVGPTTVRDVIGLTLDTAVVPTIVGPPLSDPEIVFPAATIDALNDRIEIDDLLDRMREVEGDPYVATRELYLRQREAEIAQACGKGDVVVDPNLPPRPGKGVE